MTDAEFLDLILGAPPDEYRAPEGPSFVCRWPLEARCGTGATRGRQSEEDSAMAWSIAWSPWHAAMSLRRGERASRENARLKVDLEQARREVLDLECELARDKGVPEV